MIYNDWRILQLIALISNSAEEKYGSIKSKRTLADKIIMIKFSDNCHNGSCEEIELWRQFA